MTIIVSNAVTSSVISAIISGVSTITSRCEIYERDGITRWGPGEGVERLISGAVDVDYTRDERRTLEISLNNSDGVLNHSPRGFWYDKILKVYRGIKYNFNSQEFETQVGEFYIDKISKKNSSTQTAVVARDATKKLLGAKFGTTVTFQAGGSLDQLITNIAANAGIFKRISGVPNVTISAQLSFDRASDRWSAIKSLCDSNSVEVYFDPQGYLVTRNFKDPLLSPIDLVLQTGQPSGNLVSYTENADDSLISNIVVVTGDNGSEVSSGNLYQFTAVNDNLASPTSVQLLGERYYFYTSSFFTSQAQVETTARNILQLRALESFNIDFESLCFPWMEVGNIVQFIPSDIQESEPDRFLLTNIKIPLGVGKMSGNARRVILVSNS